jgi:hypothetical protein
MARGDQDHCRVPVPMPILAHSRYQGIDLFHIKVFAPQSKLFQTVEAFFEMSRRLSDARPVGGFFLAAPIYGPFYDRDALCGS